MNYYVKNVAGDIIATFRNIQLALFFVQKFVEEHEMLVGEAWIIVKARDEDESYSSCSENYESYENYESECDKSVKDGDEKNGSEKTKRKSRTKKAQ